MFFEDLIKTTKLIIPKDKNGQIKTKPSDPQYKSSLGMKYPSLRDSLLKTGETWLNGKRMDDGAEGLWRIHDQLYDFTDFIKKHPGGEDWLRLTKGTDITEAFEVHHISELPEHMLGKFFIRQAKTPRNYPFTFKEDGFYKTLKRKLRPIIKSAPKNPISTTKMYTDSLMILMFVFAVLTVKMGSFWIGALTGLLLSLTAIAAHNFFHMRDNFRMYYFDLCTAASREWRIVHALSHHLHTNTLQDLEISLFEPWTQFLPNPSKSFFARYVAILQSPIIYMSVLGATYIKKILAILIDNKGANRINKAVFIPLLLPTVMYLFNSSNLWTVFLWWIYILHVCSFFFGAIAINSAHHHPEVFHELDTPRPLEERDWGISQIDAVADRKELSNSDFLVLISFGDHVLHHMFPTVDHGQLKYLYAALDKTCEQFALKRHDKSPLEMFVGQFRQLMNNRPNPLPPGFKNCQ